MGADDMIRLSDGYDLRNGGLISRDGQALLERELPKPKGGTNIFNKKGT